MTASATKKRTEVFALWKKEGEKGGNYFSGKLEGQDQFIKAFYNTKKKNLKEPDLRVYEDKKGEKLEKAIASLWVNTSKNGKKYLTGSFGDKKIVAFIDEKADANHPYIKAYLQEEKKAEEQKGNWVEGDSQTELPF